MATAKRAKPRKKRPGNAGTRTRLTKTLQKSLCAAIGRGHTFERAVLLAGISRTSFYDWKKRGERDREAGKGSTYAEFADAIKRAEAQFVDTHLQIIEKAATDGSWQASMTLLERKYHREFGRRQLLEHTGSEDHPPVSIRLVPRKKKDDK